MFSDVLWRVWPSGDLEKRRWRRRMQPQPSDTRRAKQLCRAVACRKIRCHCGADPGLAYLVSSWISLPAQILLVSQVCRCEVTSGWICATTSARFTRTALATKCRAIVNSSFPAIASAPSAQHSQPTRKSQRSPHSGIGSGVVVF